MAFLTKTLNSGIAERMRISSAGDVTVSTGNLVIGTSGKGIDFSATSDGSGTTTSELLDDYEEGTFTPIMVYGTTAYSLSSNSYAAYTKIGQLVHVTMQIQLANAEASNSASVQISFAGLPFATNADNPGSNQFAYNTMSTRYSLYNEPNTISATAYVEPNGTTMRGIKMFNNGNAWLVIMSDEVYVAGGTNHIQITGAYRAA